VGEVRYLRAVQARWKAWWRNRRIVQSRMANSTLSDPQLSVEPHIWDIHDRVWDSYSALKGNGSIITSPSIVACPISKRTPTDQLSQYREDRSGDKVVMSSCNNCVRRCCKTDLRPCGIARFSNREECYSNSQWSVNILSLKLMSHQL
jgi:hypothetical protein